MHLTALYLSDFRNHGQKEFFFDHGINCLVGSNGVGKTNLLDAIHYLSFTKSALNALDIHSIRHGTKKFLLRGKFLLKNTLSEVVCTYGLGVKKTIQVDGHQIHKLANHIGNYPLVLVAPSDSNLITGGSMGRRKLFDRLIAQTDSVYLNSLIIYANQLKQRNTLLKSSTWKDIDHDLLTIYDQKLILTGTHIYTKRNEFINKFLPMFTRHYAFLLDGEHEKVSITYRSDYQNKEDIATEINRSLKQDILTQRTNIGTHRDDFLFFLNNSYLKHIGSQGQQKSFLIALKISEFQYLEENKGIAPIMLMDDIFDKLDENRIEKIVAYIKKGVFGQLFITDAHRFRSRQLFKKNNINFTMTLLEGKK